MLRVHRINLFHIRLSVHLFFKISATQGDTQEGDFVVVDCAKTTKSGGECRSLSRFNTSAARDLRPREDDSVLLNCYDAQNRRAGPF